MDQRIWDPNNTFNAGPYRNLNRVRTQAALAVDGLRTYVPTGLADIARMFDFVAYTQVLMGEHYCNGVPLSSFVGTTVVFGDPLSNDSLFRLAIANADSALGIVQGSDSARVANFAKVIRGRALLDRGDTAGARTAVAGVPRSFRYDVTHSLNVNDNQLWALNVSSRRYTMGDLEGGTGLPYVTGDSIKYPIILPPAFATSKKIGDPRIPTRTGPDGIFDSAFPTKVIRQGAWGRTSSVTIASGVEARLIVAEVALCEHRLSDRRVVQGGELRRRDPDVNSRGGAEQPKLPRMHRSQSVTNAVERRDARGRPERRPRGVFRGGRSSS